MFWTAVFIGSQSSADDGSKQTSREVRIDPISRNFMAPVLEDFLRPDEAGLKYEEVFFPNYQIHCRAPQDWDWLQQQLAPSESIQCGVRFRSHIPKVR